MTEAIVGQTITMRFEGPVIEGYHVEDTTFDNCSIVRPADPSSRATLRNVALDRITQRACFINGAVLEDVVLSDLKRLGDFPLFLWASVFRRVTLSGKLSAIIINRHIEPGGGPKQPAWDRANRAYYESVDWALDISRAEFQGSIALHAIPGRLVRRDEETQVLVSRDRLQQVDWRSLPWGDTPFAVTISMFLDDGLFSDAVLVAPKRSKKFRQYLRVLEMLRREKLAV